MRPKDMDFLAHAKILLRHLLNNCILRNTPLILVVAFAFLLIGPSYAADHQWGKKVIDWVTTPVVDNKVEEDTTNPPNGVPRDDNQNIESTDESKEDTKQDNNLPETDDEEELTESSKLISAKDLLLDAEKPEVLTSKEYDQIFFCCDEYRIENWTSESCLQEKVHAFVEDKLAIQSSPNYDMVGIPQSVQDSIASASTTEATMKTAIELVGIINIRKNAYEEPEEGEEEVDTSYLLAKLLRENYGFYGDAFHFQEASDSAAYTLYGRSITWGFKTLNYASEREEFCKALEIIAERYEKITEVVSANSQEFPYAGLLRDAFENEAKIIFK